MNSIDEQILAQGLGDTDTTVKQTPWTIDLGSDRLTFNSPEELSANLKEALAQVNQEVTRLKTDNTTLRNNAQAGQYAESDDAVVNTPKFNMDTFISQMKSDPVKAFDYVDSIRYGTEKPTEYIKESLKRSEEIRQEAEVGKFLQAHPEFPGGQAAIVLNRTREQLGMPMNKAGMEAAYAHAVQSQQMPDYRTQAILQNQQQQFFQYLQNNNIPLPQGAQPQVNNNVPRQQAQGPYQNNYPVMTPNGPAGIPTVPRNQLSQNDQMVLNKADDMSLAQLESILRANGAL